MSSSDKIELRFRAAERPASNIARLPKAQEGAAKDSQNPTKNPEINPEETSGTPPGGHQGQNRGQRQGQGTAQPKPQPQQTLRKHPAKHQVPAKMDLPPVVVKPVVPQAKMRRRHRGIVASFLLVVLVPTLLASAYLALLAQDQYRSTAGFVVRQDEGNLTASSLTGLAQFVGGPVSSDGDVLFEFVQSQGLVAAIDQKLDIRAHYSQHWPENLHEWLWGGDPVFSIWPEATIEDLSNYWQRMMRISFDQATGLIEVQVLAFDPDTAQRIAQEILDQSQTMINALNETARADAMRYANTDLDTALQRLKNAREALTQFRTRTQIVDPLADLQGRMGVLTNLQQQLAETLVEYDLLQNTTTENDPRVTQAERRIQVIQDRIMSERANFTDADSTSAVAEDYPLLLAEYESLLVDTEFAEEAYRLALSSVEVARSNATRQSRYLATYIQPSLPQSSEFPQRFVLVGLAALFLTLLWGVGALVYYSIRDRQ